MAVTRSDILRRRTIAGGRPFGDFGPYEQIAGTLHFAIGPGDPYNQAIVDICLAPRNQKDKVEFSADFALLQPADPSWVAAPGTRSSSLMPRSSPNGRLLFDVLNRGQQRALNVFNDSAGGEPMLEAEMDPGNGYLMRNGYTVAWCGWQQDLPSHEGERMGLHGPVLLDSVQGFVLCEFQPSAPTNLMELSDLNHQPYPLADPEDPTATLTVREFTEAPRRPVPRDQWHFEVRSAVRSAGFSPQGPTHIRLTSGFQPGLLYEAVYRARDARVVGLGLLAVRDVVSWLRYAPGAPSTGRLSHAYGFGRSQSGRFLRHFLYLGLNQDEAGRTVFDGAIPLVTGARRGEFNLRFGQPSKTLGQGVGALPPFTDQDLVPPPQPKLMTINSSAEYWGGDRGSGGQASLLHTNPDGSQDVHPPEDSRIYLLSGTQHVGVPIPPANVTTNAIKGQHPFNCINYNPYLRAALAGMDRWVVNGEIPPPSRYPRLDDGTAVRPDFAAAALDALPDVQGPLHLPRLVRMDFGPGLEEGVPDRLPPSLGEPYSHYVSALDHDGNEVAGIRSPEVAVPLATYTGWNVRHPDSGAPGEYIPMTGATLQLPRTEDEARARHDPRTPIHTRYAGKEDYLNQARSCAETLAKGGYVLEEDIDGILEGMSRLWDLYA